MNVEDLGTLANLPISPYMSLVSSEDVLVTTSGIIVAGAIVVCSEEKGGIFAARRVLSVAKLAKASVVDDACGVEDPASTGMVSKS